MMDSPPLSIAIVGAGIFGLSTALHLAQAGHNVTVFDQYDYDRSLYSPTDSSNAASVDHNKIFRASYGSELLYQRLAYDARAEWLKWNTDLASALEDGSMPGPLAALFAQRAMVFDACGMLRVQPSSGLDAHEMLTLSNMESEGLRETQFVLSDERDRLRAADAGWVHKLIHFPIRDLESGSDLLSTSGEPTFHEAVLDSTAGFVQCSKACAFAMFLAQRRGVRFVLGDPRGKFTGLIEEKTADGGIKAIGIRTADDKQHRADLVVLAAGPHTHVLLPSTAAHIESTCGSVVTIRIPTDAHELRDKYASDHFPVILWRNSRDTGNIYALPSTEEGLVKIGYRGVKFTNFESIAPHRKLLAIPLKPEQSTALPLPSLQKIKSFVANFLPDLAHLPIHNTRLCWYTDSIDNSFLIDFVPEYSDRSVFVCTGGSGHGAKFLPVLGKHVCDVIHGKPRTALTSLWRWRTPEVLRGNGLQEGPSGPRVIHNFPRSAPTRFQEID